MVEALEKAQTSWREFFADKKLVIWGASRGGIQARDFLARNGFNLTAWCDNDQGKWGKRIYGTDVLSPRQLIETMTKEERDSHVIIIASYVFGDIFRQIRGLHGDVPVWAYYMYDPCRLKSGKVFSEVEKRRIRDIYGRETYTSGLLDLILDKGFLNSHQFGHIDECL